MKYYSVKEVVAALRENGNGDKSFSEDAIRKMIKQNRMPSGVQVKKMGWQYLIIAESDKDLRDKFPNKFQRIKYSHSPVK